MTGMRLCSKSPIMVVLLLLLFVMIGLTAHAEEQGNNTTLTFCSAGLYPYVAEESLQAFQQAYPTIDVLMKDTDAPVGSIQDWYIENISAGYKECDLFVFFGASENLDFLIHRGLVAPLVDADLHADVIQMDWAISDYVMDDRGVLYAYPVSVYHDFHSVRNDLMEMIGLGDVPATMGDYLDQQLQWYTSEECTPYREKYRFDAQVDGDDMLEDAFWRLERSYIHAYTHCGLREDDGPLLFNTPAFRKALEKLLPLAKVQPVDEEITQNYPAVYNWPYDLQSVDENETILYDIPFIEGADQQVIHAIPVFFVLNPNSQHRDEAMTFLRWYATNKTPEQAFQLCPFDPYTGTDEHILAHEQEYRDIIANTCLDRNLYQYIMVWKLDVWDIISPYFKGEATSSEVLTELDHQIAEQLNLLR